MLHLLPALQVRFSGTPKMASEQNHARDLRMTAYRGGSQNLLRLASFSPQPSSLSERPCDLRDPTPDVALYSTRNVSNLIEPERKSPLHAARG